MNPYYGCLSMYHYVNNHTWYNGLYGKNTYDKYGEKKAKALALPKITLIFEGDNIAKYELVLFRIMYTNIIHKDEDNEVIPNNDDYITHVTAFDVDPDNPNYCVKNNVLYNKDMTEVIFDLSRETIMRKKEDGSINDYLTQINQRCEWVNKTATLLQPNSPKPSAPAAPKSAEVKAEVKTANSASTTTSKKSESIVSKIFKKFFK